MTGIVEACCVGAEGATAVDAAQGAAVKGEAEVANLFAALLLAWSGGLVAPDGQLQDAAAMQAAEGDTVAGEVEAVGNASPPPQQVMAVSGGDTAAAGLSPEISANAVAASAANEAVELMAAEASPDASGAAPAAGASNDAAVGDAVSPHLQQEQSVVSEVFQEPELSAEITGNARPPELEAGAGPQPEGSPVPVPTASPADTNTLVFAEETTDTQDDAVPVEFRGAVETESAPSGSAHTQAGGERVLMDAQREMQQDGNDLARGSGERLLQGNLAHTNAMRTPRVVDGFDNTMSRVSDVPSAQLTQSVIDQTVRSVLLSVRDGSSELRVRLKPEHLGELHLRVVFKDNVLHLDVSTQSTVVKSVLDSNLGQLRQSLDNSGLDTGKLSVSVDPDLSSGGDSSRQAHGFQPFENDWTPYRADDEMPSDTVSQIARMRYAVGRLDLIA